MRSRCEKQGDGGVIGGSARADCSPIKAGAN